MYVPESSLHWNLALDWFDVNANVADVLETVPDGPEVIVALGGGVRAAALATEKSATSPRAATTSRRTTAIRSRTPPT